FDTKEFAPLSKPAVRPNYSRPRAAGSTSDGSAQQSFRLCRQKSRGEFEVRDRLRFARTAFANAHAKTRASQIGDDRWRVAMPAAVHPRSRSSPNFRAHIRFSRRQPGRDLRGLNKI